MLEKLIGFAVPIASDDAMSLSKASITNYSSSLTYAKILLNSNSYSH